MPKKKVEEVLNGLDDQIFDIVKTFLKRRRNKYHEAAVRLKNELQEDVVRYSELLEKRKISEEDFEFLVQGRSAQIKIELLEQVSVSKSRFDAVSDSVLRLIFKSVIAVIAAI